MERLAQHLLKPRRLLLSVLTTSCSPDTVSTTTIARVTNLNARPTCSLFLSCEDELPYPVVDYQFMCSVFTTIILDLYLVMTYLLPTVFDPGL